jgi:hypothetical protein
MRIARVLLKLGEKGALWLPLRLSAWNLPRHKSQVSGVVAVAAATTYDFG